MAAIAENLVGARAEQQRDAERTVAPDIHVDVERPGRFR